MAEEGVKVIRLADMMADNIGEQKSESDKVKESLVNAIEGDQRDPLFNKEDDSVSISLNPEVKEPILEDKVENPEPKGEIDDEPKDDEPKEVVVSREANFYKETLKNLYGEDLVITVEDEDGDKEVSVDDIDIDSETFKQIVEGRKEIEKQELLEGKIDAKGVSELVKNIIEIEKNGGNITEVLEAKQAYIDPLTDLDLTKVSDQKQAVYLRSKAKGMADEDISAIIRGYESEGVLEAKAKSAKSELKESVDKFVEMKRQEAEDYKKKVAEGNKVYKKNFKEKLSDIFELNDKVKDRLVDFATKVDDKGNYEIDKLYTELTKDPEKMAKLALFIYDEDEFLEQISRGKVRETQLKTARTVKITGTKIKPAGNKAPEKKERGRIYLDDLN